jgi:multiple sugar transport system permease protein
MKYTTGLISKIVTYTLLTFFGILFLLPFLWMLSTGLKGNEQMFTYPPVWIPKPMVWKNFVDAVTTISFFTFLKNTLIVAVLATFGVIISCPLVAYSLARINWNGRNILFIITIAVMMIPGQVTMVPLFIVFTKLKMVGTLAPLIIPTFFGVPFYIFLMRQFFRQLPKSLEDAARIDGCSEFQIYWRIMFPLCQPAILTIALFQFMNSWNDFLGPLIYLNDEKMYTLQLGLQQFKQAYNTQWNLLMAASILIALPIIILYFFVQRSFIQGISFGGVKG